MSTIDFLLVFCLGIAKFLLIAGHLSLLGLSIIDFCDKKYSKATYQLLMAMFFYILLKNWGTN